MRVNKLNILSDSSATMLSQIEDWRSRAIRRYKARLISKQELTDCMRWLDKLEDCYEDTELFLAGIYDEQLHKGAIK